MRWERFFYTALVVIGITVGIKACQVEGRPSKPVFSFDPVKYCNMCREAGHTARVVVLPHDVTAGTKIIIPADTQMLTIENNSGRRLCLTTNYDP